MRKYQQRQILELLQTIEEAQSLGLYADCQYGAASVEEYIESIESECTQTIALLKEYCDLLIKVSNGEVSEKRLRKQFIKVENSAKYDLKPSKIEIAFLSYKASMSDSIESIYLSAKNDPDCDAYWIPIPYYEYNSDGSISSMHYEGADCYDRKIECTDWWEYNIEVRHPDIIFTFNPYDDKNNVTSVHPNFYCKRLCGLTDLLVYIPYFVTVNDEIADAFCIVDGCVYAHKVIVQSENVRNNYIRIYKEHFGNTFGEPEDKFVALGSPKFDKVIHTKREDCILPDAWTELIGDKKVVFYNTSISAMFDGKEQYLKKLRSVIDTFRGRDDVVLWWRPHPLSETTYSSTMPQLLTEYKKIVAEYKREGWGIFDDTPDLNRAIAYGSLYYGDGSSIVALFEISGKPVFYQNINTIEYITGYPLVINSHYITGNTVYFFPIWVKSILFKMDLDALEPEVIGIIPDLDSEAPEQFNRFSDIVCIGEKLYFSTHYDDSIIEYDIKTKECTNIKIPQTENVASKIEYNSKYLFSKCIAFGKYVYFFPLTYYGILRLDTETKCVEISDTWIKDYEKYYVPEGSKFQFYFQNFQTIIINNYLFIPSSRSNSILRLNLATSKSEIIAINPANSSKDITGFSSVGVLNNEFYLLTRDRASILRWSPNEGIKQVVPIPDDLSKTGVGQYVLNAAFDGTHMCFLASFADKSISLDIITSTISDYCSENELVIDTQTNKLWMNKFFRPLIIKNRVFYQIGATNELIEFDTDGKFIKQRKRLMVSAKDTHILDEFVLKVLSAAQNNSNFEIFETPIFSLPHILDQLVKLDDSKDSPIPNGETSEHAGNRIYNYVKSLVL